MWPRHRPPRRPAPPRWADDDGRPRARILVEHPDPVAQDVLATGLRQRGYAVVTCGGPRADGMTEVTCPLLEGERCPGVDGADAIVSALPLSSGPERAIVRRIAEDPGTGPILLETSRRHVAESLGDVDVHGTVLPLTVDRVVRALDELEASTVD